MQPLLQHFSGIIFAPDSTSNAPLFRLRYGAQNRPGLILELGVDLDAIITERTTLVGQVFLPRLVVQEPGQAQ